MEKNIPSMLRPYGLCSSLHGVSDFVFSRCLLAHSCFTCLPPSARRLQAIRPTLRLRNNLKLLPPARLSTLRPPLLLRAFKVNTRAQNFFNLLPLAVAMQFPSSTPSRESACLVHRFRYRLPHCRMPSVADGRTFRDFCRVSLKDITLTRGCGC